MKFKFLAVFGVIIYFSSCASIDDLNFDKSYRVEYEGNNPLAVTSESDAQVVVTRTDI